MYKNLNFLRNVIKFFSRSSLEIIIDVVFIFCMWLFMALSRWNFIVYPWLLNPDEVQAGANVFRIFGYGIRWDSLDGTTVGPLNSLILAWPSLIGGDVTLSTIRVTALVLLSLIVLFTYLIISSLSGRFYAILLSLPLVSFYAINTNNEFQHYSSELFPLTLIMTAIYICVSIFYRRSLGGLRYGLNVGVLGLLLGAIPFAKIQATPVALSIALFALYFLCARNDRLKINVSISIFTIAGLFPAAILLLPLVSNGNFHHFWNSYIIWPTIYVGIPLTVNQLFQLVGGEQLLVLIFSLVFCLLTLFSLLNPWRSNDKRIFSWPLFFVCNLIAAFFSVIRPGNMFPHYLTFLPPLLLVMVGYFSYCSESSSYLKYLYKLIFFWLVIFFVCPQQQVDKIKDKSAYLFKFNSPRLFSYLGAGKDDKLLVWGWMPQWYIASGLIPASRESMTNNQLVNSKLQNYFRQRLLFDLDVSKPEYIIDAVAGKSFSFNIPATQGLSSFDELAKFVDSGYSLIRGVKSNSKCARTYVRKDRFSFLTSQLVKFNSVSASSSWSDEYGPESVDDYSVTEDTCSDYWLLPNGLSGYLDIKFTKAEFVKKILILNTNNSVFMNASASEILIELKKDGAVVNSINRQLNKYPNWTEIVLSEPIVSDSLRLTILSWQGNGGGINEVKVLRSEN